MIKFHVKPQDKLPIDVIKAIEKVPCKVRIDNKNGYVMIDDAGVNSLDSVIDVINKCYCILEVEIDNISSGSKLLTEDMKKDMCNNKAKHPASVFNTNLNVSDTKSINRKNRLGKGERLLQSLVGCELRKITSKKPGTDEIFDFLRSIELIRPSAQPGMLSYNERMLIYSFFASSCLQKITYSNVISAVLSNKNIAEMYKNERAIKKAMESEFRKWIQKHPGLLKEFPRIPFTSLLKVFVSHLQTN